MKRFLVRGLIGALILLLVALLALGLFLDTIVKRGVETVAPMLTKVDVKLQSVSLSLFSGSGKIEGLVIGNPQGFKTPSAIQVGVAGLKLKPGSLLADKLVINAVSVQGAEITLETDLKGNNLSKIVSNLQESTGASKQPAQTKEQAKASRKLEVDDFLITGSKVHVSATLLGGKSVTVPLPDIHLTNLGTGPEGITAAELTEQVMSAVEKGALQAASSSISDLGKSATSLGKDMGKTATDNVEKVTKGIGNLFKKK